MRFILLSVFLVLSIFSRSQDAAPDPTFGTNGLAIFQPGNSHDNAQDIVALPDGKMLIAGVTDIGSYDFSAIVGRLNDDGTLDDSFGIDGWYTLDMGNGADYFYEMVALEDGSILLCGAYSVTISNTDVMVVKLTSDGDLDMAFGGGDGMFTYAISPGEEYLQDLAVLSDGSIIVCGTATTPTFSIKGLVMKISAEGELINSFGNGGYTLAGVASDNSAYLGITTDDQQNILLAGYADVSFQYYELVSKLDADGVPMNAFGEDGHVVATNASRAFDVKWFDERILVCGAETYGATEAYVAAYTADGIPDAGFGNSGIAAVDVNEADVFIDMAILNDGKIVAGGSTGQGVPGNLDYFVCRFNADGSPDNTFGTNGQFTQSIGDMWEEINAVDIDDNGKTLLGGFLAASNIDMAIMRLGNSNPNNIPETNDAVGIYPNPASERVVITSNSPALRARIISATGALVAEYNLLQHNTVIDVSTWPSGIYSMSIQGTNSITSEKLVIN